MPDITMMPMPQGRWVMMCPCGATEIRAETGPRWAAFDLKRVAGNRYSVTCLACGHVTEHHTSPRVVGATGAGST